MPFSAEQADLITTIIKCNGVSDTHGYIHTLRREASTRELSFEAVVREYANLGNLRIVASCLQAPEFIDNTELQAELYHLALEGNVALNERRIIKQMDTSGAKQTSAHAQLATFELISGLQPTVG